MSASGRCWLLKSEPDVFSIETLRAAGQAPWDGVRNFAARNHLRAMAVGDPCLFYHSSCAVPGIVGVCRVVRTAEPDLTARDPGAPYFDPRDVGPVPRWSQVVVAGALAFSRLISRDDLRTMPALADMVLFRQGRLSVQPVTPAEYALIVNMGTSPSEVG